MRVAKLTGAFICAVLLLMVASAFADEGIIKITEKTGRVLLQSSPSAEWADAAVGQALKQKDRVKTEAGSRVTLKFPDESTVSLKSNTEIAVEELVWDNVAKKVGIDMPRGELKVVIQKVSAPSEFKVRTPTAICGARGTIFYVIVYADGTGVYVEENLVNFLSTISGQTYTVYQGTRSDAMQDGSVSKPRQLSKEEIDQILSDWDVKPVAEPYTEPAAETGGGTADDIVVPEIIGEDQASRT